MSRRRDILCFIKLPFGKPRVRQPYEIVNYFSFSGLGGRGWLIRKK